MTENKWLLIVLGLLIISVGVNAVLLLNGGQQGAPSETVIEYKDTPETLQELNTVRSDRDLYRLQVDDYRNMACAYAGVYPSMLDIVEDWAADNGLSDMLTGNMYDLDSTAQEFNSENCQ